MKNDYRSDKILLEEAFNKVYEGKVNKHDFDEKGKSMKNPESKDDAFDGEKYKNDPEYRKQYKEKHKRKLRLMVIL